MKALRLGITLALLPVLGACDYFAPSSGEAVRVSLDDPATPAPAASSGKHPRQQIKAVRQTCRKW